MRVCVHACVYAHMCVCMCTYVCMCVCVCAYCRSGGAGGGGGGGQSPPKYILGGFATPNLSTDQCILHEKATNYGKVRACTHDKRTE